MIARRFAALGVAASCLALMVAACGGDDSDDDNKGDTPSVTTEARTPSPAAVTPSSGGATPTAGRVYTQSDAQAIIESAQLVVGDLPDDGWTACQSSPISYACVLTDSVTDNAAAIEADPDGAAAFERCGRLIGRTRALAFPAEEATARYASGQTVAFFTRLTAYATEAGAIDCSAEAAAQFLEEGDLARQVGQIYIDPDAVVVAPVAFPSVADASLAATLSGQILQEGTPVELTMLIVAFRKGNVVAVVGSAAAGAPSTDELAPLVDLVIERIAAAQ